MKPKNWIAALNARVSAFKSETESQGKTFYPGASRIDLASFPPKEHWDDWIALEPVAGTGKRQEKHYMLVPTTCFNCESACGLLAYVDRETLEVRKFEGNPEHAGSRGRNCAKGPATINQVTDPDRILYPLKRAGARGEGQWTRVSWDEVLDTLAERIRKAIVEKRHREIMYHVGRPGEDGFTEDILKAWGVDGHNSHTNICSSSGRAGIQYWMGYDRPSNDFANAEVILLTSSHLEAGHYFNPHAQRIMEAKKRGARLIVVDVRMSNTSTHADHWVSPYPGSEPAIFLAVARHLIEMKRYNREFVRRWWNWHEYMTAERPDEPATFEAFEKVLGELYADYTFEYAAAESQVPVAQIEAVAETIAGAGTKLCTQNWRSAAAGNLGGWQVSRTLFLLNALLGAIGVEGSTYPNGWTKFVGKRPINAGHPEHWNDLTFPLEYPLGMNEMSFLLPHFLKEGRGTLDTYFTRVYNPVWTNPGGFDWVEMLSDESKIGLHAALTPTWNETAYFADFVLPMGHSSERHDLVSTETHNENWVTFRQPVARAARERLGETITDTREVNPGEVWEENEFWLELTWRIDPDGSLGIRQHVESMSTPGERLSLDEYYGWIFDHSIPGLPDKAEAEGVTPLAYMRRYGNVSIGAVGEALYENEIPPEQLEDEHVDPHGRVYTRAAAPPQVNGAPTPNPEPDAEGRRPAGVAIDGTVRAGFPTPSGRLEFYSSTLAQWGWPEVALPTYIKSHIHRDKLAADQMPLIPTFRLPTQIHTRGANAKWLSELAHNNPVWIHPQDAEHKGIADGQRIRVETELGFFVAEAWVTQGIRPGVVACSHHMGRWQFTGSTDHHQRTMETTLAHDGGHWSLRPVEHKQPLAPQSGPDAKRVWWTAVGVHQNLTFGVHPDPVSGQHCWHQAVRVRPAEPGDVPGQIHVDLEKSDAVYREWLAMTRPADRVSPDGTRRPGWLLRPLKPTAEACKLPDSVSS
ncbi:molybdopterin dinucleotide binding domain-containing protein [Salinisphaera hydrothermalis]|uniref:Molybdopterin dinucleotide-binding subunit n=1 Tax=Salinisphaera hydrothermalis (strain C41B8) TaxID=1304275 RepID=A0A084IGG3_SALHC|nr:molybdopterin dinucleotide binding domain-containing protein [Salinisphaera hydrothermalis]KEZ75797.1 molybdopterin dinucleotide-binding subunit [Salinisphaera hydrothermalis C41B8]